MKGILDELVLRSEPKEMSSSGHWQNLEDLEEGHSY